MQASSGSFYGTFIKNNKGLVASFQATCLYSFLKKNSLTLFSFDWLNSKVLNSRLAKER